MKTRTDKEQAEYLSRKIEIKRKNGIDYTKELCEAIEFIFDHSDMNEELNMGENAREFMKMHSVILPEDKTRRLEILIENVEIVVPKLKYDHPDLKELIKDTYITLDAISNEIYNYSEEMFDDFDLPEDALIEKIGDLFLSTREKPQCAYYEITTEYVLSLINKLKDAIRSGDVKTMHATGNRLSLQSLQYEQLYKHRLTKE